MFLIFSLPVGYRKVRHLTAFCVISFISAVSPPPEICPITACQKGSGNQAENKNTNYDFFAVIFIPDYGFGVLFSAFHALIIACKGSGESGGGIYAHNVA